MRPLLYIVPQGRAETVEQVLRLRLSACALLFERAAASGAGKINSSDWLADTI
jgi:hypothetical protein